MLSNLRNEIKSGFFLFLFVIFVIGPVFGQDTVYEPYENLKSRILARINEYHNYSFVTIIGIDSSGSMTQRNQFNNACKLSNVFIQNNLIPGDEFYLFHFGPQPYPYYNKKLILPDSREAVKEIGEIQAKLVELTTNPEKGTDLNYAFYHALSVIQKDKSKNYLIILFTDHNSDNGEVNWILQGDNKSKLDEVKNLLNEKGGEKVEAMTDDKSLWAVCAYYIGNNTPIPNVNTAGFAPSPSSSPRNNWIANLNEIRTVGGNKVKFTPNIIDSETAEAVKNAEISFMNRNNDSKVEPTGSGQYFLEPGPYSIDVRAAGYDSFHGEFEVPQGSGDISKDIPLIKTPPSSPVWILILFIFLLTAGIIAFVIMRPVPVTVDITPGADEKQFILKLNDFLIIGGQEDGAKNVFSASGLNEPLVRITHIIPRRLRLDRLSGDGGVKILVEGDAELKTGSAHMGSHSEIEFPDRISGLKSTIRIFKGTQADQFSPSSGGGGEDTGDWGAGVGAGGEDDWMG